MTHSAPGTPEVNPRQFASLLDWVSSQTGLSFRGQRDTATEVLHRAIARSGVADIDDFRGRLEKICAAFDDLIGELTIGETYFFRDRGQFGLIANNFLQHIGLRPSHHQIRVWSAGCASGEEAWSLAVVFADAGLSHRCHVLGTDISRPALMHAQIAQYREWSMRGQAVERMRPWVNKDGDHYTIVPRLRPSVSFEYLNLAEDTYPSFTSNTVGMDLILCRNVLIYFDQVTIRRVAERLFQCLSPGGWLMTGASDPSLSMFAPFEVRSTAAGRVYVRPEMQPAVLTDSDSTTSLAPSRDLPRAAERPINSRVDASVQSVPRSDPQPQHVAAEQVEQALDQGNYVRVLKLTSDSNQDAKLCELRVRALANLDVEQAEAFCSEAVNEHRISRELNYLHTILLMELSRYEEAAAAAKRVVYLDRDLAVGHMALGTVMQRLGDVSGARRAFRNAQRICQSLPAEEIVPLADGEHAGRLAESAARHLSLLGDSRQRDASSI